MLNALEKDKQMIVERQQAYVDWLADWLEKAKVALQKVKTDFQEICQHEFEEVRSSLPCCKVCDKRPVIRRECKKCGLVEPVKH